MISWKDRSMNRKDKTNRYMVFVNEKENCFEKCTARKTSILGLPSQYFHRQKIKEIARKLLEISCKMFKEVALSFSYSYHYYLDLEDESFTTPYFPLIY